MGPTSVRYVNAIARRGRNRGATGHAHARPSEFFAACCPGRALFEREDAMAPAASNLATLPATARALIAQIIGIPRDRVVGSAALSADLGATSLDAVEIVMAMEDEFEIEISDDHAAGVVTVDDLESLILRLRAARRPPVAA